MTPATGDPTAETPDPPARDLGIVKVRIALTPTDNPHALGHKPEMPRGEVGFVHRVVRIMRDRFRVGLTSAGLHLGPGEHPIIPILLGDAALASTMAERLLTRGIYVIGFSYPVVPMGKARIRTQMSAALSVADIDTAIAAFTAVALELKLVDPNNSTNSGDTR